MVNLPDLVTSKVAKPSFAMMEKAYQDYRKVNNEDHTHPCRTKHKGQPIKNQCAVRMSLALERCGFWLFDFPDRKRVHRFKPTCGIDPPHLGHVLGAEELADFLVTRWGIDQAFNGNKSAKTARTAIAGQNGIIYFNNCFTKAGSDKRQGDHIDLWYGSLNNYFIQIANLPAGQEDQASAQPLFERSDRIWFFRLY